MLSGSLFLILVQLSFHKLKALLLSLMLHRRDFNLMVYSEIAHMMTRADGAIIIFNTTAFGNFNTTAFGKLDKNENCIQSNK